MDGLPNIPRRILPTCPNSTPTLSTRSSHDLSLRELLSILELRFKTLSTSYCRNGTKHVITVQTQQPSSLLSRTGSNGNTLESNSKNMKLDWAEDICWGLTLKTEVNCFSFIQREFGVYSGGTRRRRMELSRHSHWQYEVISFLSSSDERSRRRSSFVLTSITICPSCDEDESGYGGRLIRGGRI
jgi:hypothetical protein